MNYNILITGGAGFIGSHFVDLLLEKKYNIFVLDALTYASNINNLPLDKIQFIQGNICDKELVYSILVKNSIMALVNFAAESHVDNSIADASSFLETNIVGTYSLLEATRRYLSNYSVQNFKYIQVSTDEVYGTLGDHGFFNEKSNISPRSPYSASKASADHLVQSWFHTYNIPSIITRCSNNFGPRQHFEKLIPKIIKNALNEEKIPIYGAGKNIRDWIYVKDHCKGIELALEKGIIGEIYCFGGLSELRNIDLVKKICFLLDKIKPRHDHSSYFELIDFVDDRLGHDYRYAIDIQYAKKKLDFFPKYDFSSSLLETINWYLSRIK